MSRTYSSVTVTAAFARELLDAVVSEGHARGVALAVAVVDERGDLIAFTRMDGAGVMSAQAAQDKAFTALGNGAPTDQLYEAMREDRAMLLGATTGVERFLLLGGGVPIVIDGQLVGALGVAGGHHTQDAEAAKAELGDSVRSWCADRRLDHFDASRGRYGVERAGECGVTVADEEPELLAGMLRHADGLGAGVPFVYTDPDDFTLALHHVIFIVEDGDDFENYVDNPLLKWWAATGGRFEQADWRKYGLEPPFPDDWHYAWKMKPNSMTMDEIDEVLAKVPPEMVRETFLHGTPKQIAEQIRPYAERGCNLNLIADLAPLLIPTQPEVTIRQSSEICRMVKEAL